MTSLPDWALTPRRLDGAAVRMAPKPGGGAEFLEWDGDAWSRAKVDVGAFMAAPPASPSFLDKIGVPADDPSRPTPAPDA